MRQGNPPRIMGNCSTCCYATNLREGYVRALCDCARYPQRVEVDAINHFCGEFVSKRDYKDACEGRW